MRARIQTEGDEVPREYKLKLKDRYGISDYRYQELRAFCLQHEEKKAELKQLYSLSSISTEISVMGGVPGKPTERKALKADELKRDIDMVENCLAEACGDDVGLIEYLRKNVTLGHGFDSLGYVPCGINQFYKARRKFFCLLNNAKK